MPSGISMPLNMWSHGQPKVHEGEGFLSLPPHHVQHTSCCINLTQSKSELKLEDATSDTDNYFCWGS